MNANDHFQSLIFLCHFCKTNSASLHIKEDCSKEITIISNSVNSRRFLLAIKPFLVSITFKKGKSDFMKLELNSVFTCSEESLSRRRKAYNKNNDVWKRKQLRNTQEAISTANRKGKGSWFGKWKRRMTGYWFENWFWDRYLLFLWWDFSMNNHVVNIHESIRHLQSSCFAFLS